MPIINTDRHLRRVRNLEFCYICGNEFTKENPATDDHVPPKKIFKAVDVGNRTLILNAHRVCNNSNSATDEIMGQLLSIVHAPHKSRRKLKGLLRQTARPDTGEPVLALEGINLKSAIWRWIRGFHAALYERFLPNDIDFSLLEPLPRSDRVFGGVIPAGIMEQYAHISSIVKRSRTTGRIDSISAYGGSVRYECTWLKSDSGDRFGCFFALDVYNWMKLGSRELGPQRGCIGHYIDPLGMPETATFNPGIVDIPIRNLDPLDPFEDYHSQ
jgi:hypothetical protein